MSKFKVGDLVKVDFSSRMPLPQYGWEVHVDTEKVYTVTEARGEVYTLGGSCFKFIESLLVSAFKFEIGDEVALENSNSLGAVVDRKYNAEDRYACYAISKNGWVVWIPDDGRLAKCATPAAPITLLKVKRGKFAVLEKMNEYFDWYIDSEAFEIIAGIRGGTIVVDYDNPLYKSKHFELHEMKNAYRWLVKQGRKMDDGFDGWMNGDWDE